MSFIPRPYQQQAIDIAVDFFHDKKKQFNGFEILPTGCHAYGTEILMWDGTTKKVEYIAVGDLVMGINGESRKVLSLHRGMDAMYKIKPHKGCDPFIVNRGHILHLVSTSEGKKAVSPSHQRGGEVTHISVGDYLMKSKYWKHLRKLTRSQLINFPFSFYPLELPPYILGLILGDGCVLNNGVSVTTADIEIDAAIREFSASWGLSVRTSAKKNNAAHGLHIIKSKHKKNQMENPLMKVLRDLKIAGTGSATKFIPHHFKVDSIESRLAILAGLIDTDGSYSNGGYDYISKSKRLSDDVTFIARSLGLSAHQSECTKSCQNGFSGQYHRVNITGDTAIIPCRIERKKAKKREQKKNNLVSGFSIESAGLGYYCGFEVDGDHLYVTADFMIHHNSGKSLIIAHIAMGLNGKVLILQPSVEILKQNVSKFQSYGYRAGVYSASAGSKFTDKVTFAMIGSIVKKAHLFKDVEHVIIDECHLVAPDGGMYHDFIHGIEGMKALGLTATPYRLTTGMDGAMLKFLNTTTPRVFSKLLYYVQNDVLFNAGHLAKLEYYPRDVIDRTKLQLKTNGSDFTEQSLRNYYKTINMPKIVAHFSERLLAKRKNLLVFCSLLSEAHEAAKLVPGAVVVTGETEPGLRSTILKKFQRGDIRCVMNVGVLTTGFDMVDLECILIARPTMSLALYYQMVGRGMRPSPNKTSSWIVDLGGNYNFFGAIETMKIHQNTRTKEYALWNNGRKLTNVAFRK